MYQLIKRTPTSLHVNQATEGESIETKVERMMMNKEPISDGAPPIYTERSEGVHPMTNIRTDKWEIMTEAMSAVTNAALGAREQRLGEKAMKNMTIEQKQEYLAKNPNIKDPSTSQNQQS